MNIQPITFTGRSSSAFDDDFNISTEVTPSFNDDELSSIDEYLLQYYGKDYFLNNYGHSTSVADFVRGNVELTETETETELEAEAKKLARKRKSERAKRKARLKRRRQKQVAVLCAILAGGTAAYGAIRHDSGAGKDSKKQDADFTDKEAIVEIIEAPTINGEGIPINTFNPEFPIIYIEEGGKPEETETIEESEQIDNYTEEELEDKLFVDTFNGTKNFEGGVLKGRGQMILDMCKEYGVSNPYLLASIMALESGWGKSNGIVNYNNPAGLMDPDTNWSSLIHFNSLESGIKSFVKNIKKGYIQEGRVTIRDIGDKYCPVGADNDPTGINGGWISSVTSIYNELTGENVTPDTILFEIDE